MENLTQGYMCYDHLLEFQAFTDLRTKQQRTKKTPHKDTHRLRSNCKQRQDDLHLDVLIHEISVASL